MFVCIMWLRVGNPDSIGFFVTESFVVGMKEGSILVFVVGFDDGDCDRISVGNEERNGFALNDGDSEGLKDGMFFREDGAKLEKVNGLLLELGRIVRDKEGDLEG